MKLRIRQCDFVTETGTKYAIFPTLISTYGVRTKTYSGNIQAEVTLDDLFMLRKFCSKLTSNDDPKHTEQPDGRC